MPRQSRPREPEIGYLSSISSQTQALYDIGLFRSRPDSRDVSKVDSDEEICLNSSENDGIYCRKPLPPPPLNLDKIKVHQARHPIHHGAVPTYLSDASAHGHSQRYDQNVIDSNPLNKRLPIEPGLLTTGRSPIEWTERDNLPNEDSETSSHHGISPTVSYSTKLQHVSQNEQGSGVCHTTVHGILATEGYERSDLGGMSHFSTHSEDEKVERLASGQSLSQRCQARRIRSHEPRADSPRTKVKNSRFRHILDGTTGKHAVPKIPRQLTLLNAKIKSALAPCPSPSYQPSTLEGMTELNERRLLSRFFGFDRMPQLDPLDEGRLRIIQYYLTIQPDPDLVIGQDIYPLASCAWLRNRIINSVYRLPFDRGRLRGLLLEDISTHTVNRGFGLLWNFLEDCGPKARCNALSMDRRKAQIDDAQREWFQVSTLAYRCAVMRRRRPFVLHETPMLR
jgi:hypothetical protein